MSELAALMELGATARRTGCVPLQLENLVTHSQYLPVYRDALRVLAAGDRVLDWGCGNGHFSLFLARLDVELHGYALEPRPPLMAGVEGYRFVQGDPADPVTLPYADARFDRVFSIGVLEHVHERGGDEEASLREIARVLRPGGTFLCFHLPNRTGWIEPVGAALRLAAHRHGRTYRAHEIPPLFARNGLRVEHQRRYGFLPRNELRRLPGRLRHSPRFGRAYNAADALLARALPGLCQNHAVIARRSEAPPEARSPRGTP